MFLFTESAGKHFVCLFVQEISVFIEENHFRRINICIAQIICHHNSIEVFASGCRVVFPGFRPELFLDFIKFLFQGKIQRQSVNDLLITVLNVFQFLGEVFACHCRAVTVIQHIRHLGIRGKTLSWRRRHHISARSICTDDISYFFELTGACQRASAELHYFFHIFLHLTHLLRHQGRFGSLLPNFISLRSYIYTIF